jgi:hypothetical protein
MPTEAEFTSLLYVKFLDATFVNDLLSTQLGVDQLFDVTYETDTLDIQTIALDAVERTQFAMPAFETLRTSGVNEKIIPGTERVQISLSQSRRGRLEWVDVYLKLRLAATVHDLSSPIDRVAVSRLIEELGGITSIADLRANLLLRYPPSVVDKFFTQLRITTLEDFLQRGNLYLEFVYRTPPPFDPENPGNARLFRLNVCVRLSHVLDVGEALQGAKLCRSILENERDYADHYEGGEIKAPYVFVTLFPDSVAVDNAIPGLTAAQIKTRVREIFESEAMFAHFVTGT